MNDTSVAQTYHVVVNHEEQYSIWPTDRAIPNGWALVGLMGSKDTCLEYIEKAWTDMRPLSLRQSITQADTDPPSS